MKVLDLFSGLGGWSQAFKDRGHEVITVDIEGKFNPTITGDIMKSDTIQALELYGKFDIILASPPCTEFSKASMPDSWNKNRTVNPDTKLLERTIDVINYLKPKFFIIENVNGARRFFMPIIGRYKKKVGSRYLWGEFPVFDCEQIYGKWKLPPTKDRAALRGKIPYKLSLAVCEAVERELKP